MESVMDRTLLLNVTYEPLRIISWKRAIVMLTLGKVEVVEEYDRDVRSITFSLKMPSVVRLLHYVKSGKRKIKFSRANIYARDKYTCQYCGNRKPTEELTYDHIFPKSRGGETCWENIVTACYDCNMKKGGRTPAEKGMKLLKKPKRPEWLPVVNICLHLKDPPDNWMSYLYWTTELVN